jgi:hypothetical protein
VFDDAAAHANSCPLVVFGVLLPWLGVLAVAGGMAYGVIRLARGRRP